jgi:hypothetical protein
VFLYLPFMASFPKNNTLTGSARCVRDEGFLYSAGGSFTKRKKL